MTLPARYVQANLMRSAAWGLLGLGVAFVLLRSVIAPVPEVDFRFLWLAGRLWNQGIDPYSPAYGALAPQMLPSGNVTRAWVYPPNWWAICRSLALLDLRTAVALWRLLSGAMLAGGAYILARALFNRQKDLSIALAATGVACLIEPSANAIALGQTAAIIYLGLCLIVAGIVRESRWLVVSGLVLISLKPQIAAPVMLALLFVRANWLPIAAALMIGLALALPQLLTFNPLTSLHNLLSSLSGYSGAGMTAERNPNSPVSSTGFINLLGRLSVGVTLFEGYFAGLAGAIFAGLTLRGHSVARRNAGLLFLLAVLVGIMPLHIYDMTILIIPALFYGYMRGTKGWIALIPLLLAVRPGKIEGMLGVPIYGGGVSSGTIGLSVAGMLFVGLALREIALSYHVISQPQDHSAVST